MQVVGYARVSTEHQARDGVSIAAQQAKIEAYATVKDWTFLERIRDEGQSAKHLKRPGLERVLALVSLQESLDATTATGRLMMNLLARRRVA